MHSSEYWQKCQTNSTELVNTEIIVHDTTHEQKQSCLSWLRYFCTYLMHHLLRGYEPWVWEKRNSAGERYYRCYNPHTGCSIHCNTETEVRAWFEQLPYC